MSNQYAEARAIVLECMSWRRVGMLEESGKETALWRLQGRSAANTRGVLYTKIKLKTKKESQEARQILCRTHTYTRCCFGEPDMQPPALCRPVSANAMPGCEEPSVHLEGPTVALPCRCTTSLQTERDNRKRQRKEDG